MHTAVIFIHIFVSIFLILVVLLQSGKGASMGAVFGGSSNQTLFGSSGPASMLSKLTAFCAIIFMMTSLYLAYTSVPRINSTILDNVNTNQSVPPSNTPVGK